MGFWNYKRECFEPMQSEDTTTINYSDEQIRAMYEQGKVVTGAEGEPVVMPRPQPTAEEMKENLRRQRDAECFHYINRGQLWYDSLTDEQYDELQKWYADWLDVTETMIAPTKPLWLN